MAFLGKDPVRCKFVEDNKCLQQVKHSNFCALKFPVIMKRYSTKSRNIFSNPGNSEQCSQTNFGEKIFKNKSM